MWATALRPTQVAANHTQKSSYSGKRSDKSIVHRRWNRALLNTDNINQPFETSNLRRCGCPCPWKICPWVRVQVLPCTNHQRCIQANTTVPLFLHRYGVEGNSSICMYSACANPDILCAHRCIFHVQVHIESVARCVFPQSKIMNAYTSTQQYQILNDWYTVHTTYTSNNSQSMQNGRIVICKMENVCSFCHDHQMHRAIGSTEKRTHMVNWINAVNNFILLTIPTKIPIKCLQVTLIQMFACQSERLWLNISILNYL